MRPVRHLSRRFSLLLLTGVAVAVLLGGSAGAREVTLLSVTDFHGALMAGGRDNRTNRAWGGAVAVEQLVRHERALRPDRTFLLDAGDEMQGTPESNFLFGRSAIHVLNELGTDAAALGNHDFDWGVDTLCARLANMKYPMLAANVFDRRTGRRPAWVRPYTIITRDGIRLGVIGFATPETPRVTLPQNVATLRFDPPAEIVGPLLRKVRARADVVVVLCHFGGEQAEDGTIGGPIADIARAARGADAVIGGHTHTWIAGLVEGIPVLVAGSNGRCLGRVVLELDGGRRVASPPVLLRAYSDSLQVADWDPIARYVRAVHADVAPLVSRVLGEAARRLGRNELANLVTDAMRAAAGADVAITNPGGLRRDLEAGPITVGDVFELLPFENAMVTMRLSGRQLRAVIASRPEKALLSGLRGSWNPQAPADSQLVLECADGRPLQPDSSYAVVTNSFLDQGGDGFQGFDAGSERVVTQRMLRDVVEAAIAAETRADRKIDPDSAPRLRLPPRTGH